MRNCAQCFLIVALAIGVLAFDGAAASAATLESYVEQFNEQDNELYSNIKNAEALDFLKRNIPRLECPDEQIERAYYFRWWTYRKHVKKTTDGYVITEFLPNVPWARKHNTICCPAGHHFYEGRWLHDKQIMSDYALFWFRKGGGPRQYSFWAADAMWADYLVHGDKERVTELLDDLVLNYEGWEASRLLPDGMFWQIDDRDGMECSVGKSGKRATINSYMYGDAVAISKIATLAERADIAKTYAEKAQRLRRLVNERLWDEDAKFYKTLPRSQYEKTEPRSSADQAVTRIHWYDNDHRGTLEWFQYTFLEPVELGAAEVHWLVQNKINPLPAEWRISYQVDGVWTPVKATTPYPIKLDTYCRVEFEKIKVSAVRLEVQSPEGKAAGIHEWRVFSGDKNVAGAAKITDSVNRRPNPWGNTTKTLNDGADASKEASLVDVRELHGYTPWYFNVPQPGQGREVAWQQLMDPKGFYAKFGPTTAEQRHPGFKISYEGHGCQWNGPSWPLSTSVTLTAMANVLNNYEQDAIDRADYLDILKVYAHTHRRTLADGSVVSWIDENIDPFTGTWIARRRVHEQNEKRRASGQTTGIIIERGKDYNHSSFCDLVISGLVGLRPRDDEQVEVNPLVPDDKWDWLKLDNVSYRGRILTITWDKDGRKYGEGKGLQVYADGKLIGNRATLGRLTARLPKKQ